MHEWHTYLTFEAPSLAEADPDKQSVVDGVKASVCECLILFMERNEEEFAKFLQARGGAGPGARARAAPEHA